MISYMFCNLGSVWKNNVQCSWEITSLRLFLHMQETLFTVSHCTKHISLTILMMLSDGWHMGHCVRQAPKCPLELLLQRKHRENCHLVFGLEADNFISLVFSITCLLILNNPHQILVSSGCKISSLYKLRFPGAGGEPKQSLNMHIK